MQYAAQLQSLKNAISKSSLGENSPSRRHSKFLKSKSFTSETVTTTSPFTSSPVECPDLKPNDNIQKMYELFSKDVQSQEFLLMQDLLYIMMVKELKFLNIRAWMVL
jgi:hypothetical protein